LLTAHQYTNYNRLKYGVINKINRFESLEDFNLFKNDNNFSLNKELDMVSMEEEFLHHWIIGFINGEGCFHIRNGKTFIFYIEQAESQVLYLIKNILQFSPSVLERKQRGNRKITFSLYISKKEDISNLILFLDIYQFLKGKKANQYQYWKTEY
jgi:intein/homing endonuclease